MFVLNVRHVHASLQEFVFESPIGVALFFQIFFGIPLDRGSSRRRTIRLVSSDRSYRAVRAFRRRSFLYNKESKEKNKKLDTHQNDAKTDSGFIFCRVLTDTTESDFWDGNSWIVGAEPEDLLFARAAALDCFSCSALFLFAIAALLNAGPSVVRQKLPPVLPEDTLLPFWDRRLWKSSSSSSRGLGSSNERAGSDSCGSVRRAREGCMGRGADMRQ